MNFALKVKNVKYFINCAVVILSLVFIASPVMAATRRSPRMPPNTAPASYGQFYQDGSNVPSSSSWQQTRGYGQQSSDLQQKIAALGNTANYPVFMPVLFGVGVKDISPNFGDPRSGGRTHEGEDIMAVKGTPIVSPTSAVVTHTSMDLGASEGIAVYTANPGGETFVYYHLDRIGEGVVSGLVLEQGSLIGYVGNTGNASGGAAHLHFEIHNSSGTPMAPFPRLTVEFSLQEKMSYLSKILLQTSDSAALVKFLMSNFHYVFDTALAANITLPPPIIGALITDGALIRAIGSADVYIVKYINGKKFKRLILNPKVFNSYGHLHWEDIMDVAPEIINGFTISDLVRATVAGDPRVYKLYPNGDIGEKHWIKTAEAFTRLGYDWDAVYTINAIDRDSYIEMGVLE